MRTICLTRVKTFRSYTVLSIHLKPVTFVCNSGSPKRHYKSHITQYYSDLQLTVGKAKKKEEKKQNPILSHVAYIL